ncbi:MAG: ACP S-malonyltransferase [Candidatus Marinimicrobia bacterium]|jgi:[acyl-carrier-protein] S-malonyltransferase|nr:ACP S-malonyltransferase [Candidatus Neomarinimicrobiota bacterium]MBT3576519.1 ACP S-malonyltransferase [Candidatus Neomarinimicrobiota bacterium]MBT3681305.1 ACP S-malonyltransferase [Candidatus Neomarinimicrobiota bacterium]MBT3951519.1 ACP S-malonyltransferase [Candidatus Neomarinimicrobiota bacterium]MBT4253911.1 ACP S-malonyltransferase [Candidatus Neomarinimicrobiota bacterium]
MKRALVFPGQASQYVGMGQDIFDKHQSVKDMYTIANEILGFDVADVSFNGPLEALTETKVTQPALFVTSAALFTLLPKSYEFSMTAGHSLGEFSALFAAGVLSFEDALSIVKVRSEGMQAAGESQTGTMAAILNMSRKDITKVCKHASLRGIVQAANYNSPGQIVISGETVAVHYAMEIAKNLGARKALALNVSGAFHSPLMAPAKDDLSVIIEKTKFKKAKVPVVANVDASPTSDPAKIKNNLIEQLENPVLWEDTVQYMVKDGVEEIVEIGPGKVLQGLVKRIHRDMPTGGVANQEQLEVIS